MAELNPAEIGGNITTELKDIVSGDFDIGGHKIPKIALIGGGAVLIVLLFLLAKRSGGSAGKGAFQSPSSLDSSSASGFGTTDAPIGGAVGGGQSPLDTGGLATVIDNGQAATGADFQDQLNRLQDQLSNIDLSYPVGALPTDSYTPVMSMPYSDAGLNYMGGSSSFNETAGVSNNPLVPSRSKLPTIEPSHKKAGGGAKLGVAKSQKASRGSDLTSKLGKAPKLSAANQVKPSAVTGFNKHGLNVPSVKPGHYDPLSSAYQKHAKPVIVTPNKQGMTKQPAKPSITPQKTTYSGIPSASGKKPPIVASNALYGYLTDRIKASQKTVVRVVPYRTPQKTTYNQPYAAPKPQPYNVIKKYTPIGVKKNK